MSFGFAFASTVNSYAMVGTCSPIQFLQSITFVTHVYHTMMSQWYYRLSIFCEAPVHSLITLTFSPAPAPLFVLHTILTVIKCVLLTTISKSISCCGSQSQIKLQFSWYFFPCHIDVKYESPRPSCSFHISVLDINCSVVPCCACAW